MIFTNNNSTYEDHEFWNESRIKIFETLLNMTPVSACWQRKHLKKALLIISSELSITKKFALSEIIELLEYGKENNFFDHQISIRSFHKQHRHTVLNSLLNNSEHLEATQNLYKGIWEKYLTRNLEVDDLLLPLICTMLHDNAFGANITPQLIYQVKICDVTVDQAFILPLTADDTS